MTVGWGIVGLGGIARLMARAIGQAENASLAAVCSRDPAKAAEFAAAHGAARRVTDYQAMLADPSVDAVYVATPNALHASQTLAALQAGKHVLVEKPMALGVGDARRMVAAARAAGRVLGVGFHLRHHPVHQEIKRRISSGEAGDPIFAVALWGSYAPALAQQRERWQMQPALAGAGSIMGLGVHEIDLLRWLLDQEVVEVAALTDGPSEDYPVEFLTAATLRFERGAIPQLVSSRRLPNGTNGVTIYGTNERLDGEETLGMTPAGQLRITRGAQTTVDRVALGDAYLTEVEAFSRAVEGDGVFAASGDDGVRSVAITAAILEAARTGRSVRLHGTEPPNS
jgi:1,5-anhydro-D-fructose reductase (1,5-anhydro-D-mannitol-forming)